MIGTAETARIANENQGNASLIESANQCQLILSGLDAADAENVLVLLRTIFIDPEKLVAHRVGHYDRRAPDVQRAFDDLLFGNAVGKKHTHGLQAEPG